ELERVRTGQAGYLPQEPPPEMARPIAPEPQPAASETNPREASKTAAAAAGSANEKSEKNQTNPTIPDFRLKWDLSDGPYILSSEEWRQVIAGREDESTLLMKK
ncbi:MAG: hypothetical protein KIT09_18620, partial [Bryobacteraceae bacterium]|nr:hypothetical protein [Bryobacteraceae bacterium]